MNESSASADRIEVAQQYQQQEAEQQSGTTVAQDQSPLAAAAAAEAGCVLAGFNPYGAHLELAVEDTVNEFWVQNQSQDAQQVTAPPSQRGTSSQSGSGTSSQAMLDKKSSDSSDTRTAAPEDQPLLDKKRKAHPESDRQRAIAQAKRARAAGGGPEQDAGSSSDGSGKASSPSSGENSSSASSLVIYDDGEDRGDYEGSSSSHLFEWATLLHKRPDNASSKEQMKSWLLEVLNVSQGVALHQQDASLKVACSSSGTNTSNSNGSNNEYCSSNSEVDGTNSDIRSSASSGPTYQSGMTGSSRTDGSSADDSSSCERDANESSLSSDR